jgi:hypothetical protein
MARHIYDELGGELKNRAGVRVAWVRLWETDAASVKYWPGTVA